MPRFTDFEIERIAQALDASLIKARLEDPHREPRVNPELLSSILNSRRQNADSQQAIASAILDEFADEKGDVPMVDMLQAILTFVYNTLVHYAKTHSWKESRKYYLEFRRCLDTAVESAYKDLRKQEKEMEEALAGLTTEAPQ